MLKARIFIFSLVALFTFNLKAQTLSGIVTSDIEEVMHYAHVTLLDSSNHIIVKSRDVEWDGSFKLELSQKGKYAIKVSSGGYHDSTFFNLFIDGDTSISFKMRKSCEFDKSRNDKTCPVCHKADQAIPIHYGLPAVPDWQVKEYMKKLDVEFHEGGCVISGCDPNWYCKRDKKEF